MDILFVTYGKLSFGGENARPASMLRALADAGNRVDVVASHTFLPDHPHIRILTENGVQHRSRRNLRINVLRSVGRISYDAIHAVDDALPFVSRLCRVRKIPLVYDASRCFSGSTGFAPSRLWKLFSSYFAKMEQNILRQAAAILTPSNALTADIKSMVPDARIFQIEDVPVQPLFPKQSIERPTLMERFNGPSSAVVVCSIFEQNSRATQTVLMSARKVIEAIPEVAFFFKGLCVEEAESVATKLDIRGRCAFLTPDEVEEFLAALDFSDAALLVPPSGSRYVHSEVFTFLRSPAPLIAIKEVAYKNLLTEQNCVQVLWDTDSIAEGLLRLIQEPLFAIGIAAEGQQLIADNYSLSSFKHKIRMAYYTVLNHD